MYLNKIMKRITDRNNIFVAPLQCRIEFELMEILDAVHITEHMKLLASQWSR